MVQNIRQKLTETIVHQAEKAAYFCVAGNISSNQKVHELRRGFKRLRALLGFFREMPGYNAVQQQKEIRNFGKLLASLRESAVNLTLFETEFSQNKLLPEKKIKNAHEQLIQKNKLLIEHGFLENNLKNTIHSFSGDFKKDFIHKSTGFPGKHHVLSEISRSYLKSFTTYEKLPAMPHSEEWHELRKKLKRLGYQLDFFRFIHPRYFTLKTDQLNKITDQLGDDHDLYVFSRELIADSYGFNENELQILANQTEHLRKINQLMLRQRLKQFLASPPGEFEQKLKLLS